MERYKEMTYTIRKDGRITKKISIDGKPKYLYSDNPKDLFKQYIELQHSSYNGMVTITDVKFKDFSNK